MNTLTLSRGEVLARAARQLQLHADELKASHVLADGRWFIVDAADAQAKADYHELCQLAGALLAMANGD